MAKNQEEIDRKKEYLQGYEKAVRQMKRSELKIKEMRMHQVRLIYPVMPHCWIRKKSVICDIDIRELGSVRKSPIG